ncbi:MAG: GNAT family N-acetyltransferase, partial [Elusimicrobia bacterium]|nr:GNAT family N-acetyltransferase [Elusimicrobiota bacterium]
MNGKSYWLDGSPEPAWREWLSRLPAAKRDVYLDPAYARLYIESGGRAACYIFTQAEHVYLYPFIMRPVPDIPGYFDITTPYGYGGPVSDTEEPAFLQEAQRCFYAEASRRKIVAEVIKFHPLLNNQAPLQGIFPGRIVEVCPTVFVDIDQDEGHRWTGIYSHANRKNINKAKRNDISARFDQLAESWRAFQSLYELTMIDNQASGFYRFSPEYFDSIRKHMSAQYILASCVLKGDIISSLLVLLGTDFAYCHLIGTNRELMGTGVNNLLHHELILWCKEKGYKKLLIGGGRTNLTDDTL